MSGVAQEFLELDDGFVNYSDYVKPLTFNTNNMLVQYSFELPIHVAHAGGVE
jgi:hypothetical protein